MRNKKQAFSLVEIIITLSIVVLLAVVSYSFMDSMGENKYNTKVQTDLQTIDNALLSYAQDNGTLPLPGGNINFFKNDGSYAHSLTGATTFGVYGNFVENTVPKKYLYILPLDPRTNSYYSYGKTVYDSPLLKNQFETAGVLNDKEEYKAKVVGNYTAEYGIYGLIREYNGSNFVEDKSTTTLPYNPEELVLVATTASGVVYREGDTIEAPADEDLEIFFSDGSTSILEKGSKLTLSKLSFPSDNNLNTFVKLVLETGKIWTKATHLNDSSEFEVYTVDATAAVRGTIFGVTNTGSTTRIEVLQGEVGVYEAKVVGKNDGTNQVVIPGNIKEIKLNKASPKQVVKALEKVEVSNPIIESDTTVSTGAIDDTEVKEIKNNVISSFSLPRNLTNIDVKEAFDNLKGDLIFSSGTVNTGSLIKLDDDLGNNFEIEMKIRPKSNDAQFLWYINNNLSLKYKDHKLSLKYNNDLYLEKKLEPFSGSTLTIRSIFKDNEIEILVDSKSFIRTAIDNPINIEELIIGSNNRRSYPFEGEIDYIKIYKKMKINELK